MIYLASPYSHPVKAIREARFRAICMVAAAMIEQGEIVFCPIAHSHPIAELGGCPNDWETWEKQDITLLEKSAGLVVACFPGWQDSKGVAAEIAYAIELDISIEYIPYHQLPLNKEAAACQIR